MNHLEALVVHQALGDGEQGVDIALLDDAQSKEDGLVEDDIGKRHASVIHGFHQGRDVQRGGAAGRHGGGS